MSGSTKDDINKATDATEYHPPAPEDVARDAETVRGALSLLTSNDVGQRTEGFAALSRLASAAARVPGLEAKVKDLGEQYEADRYEIHAILMWAGEWGTRAPKPSRHVTALLERLRTAESERDAARQKMDAWCRTANAAEAAVSALRERAATLERERAAAQEDVDSYARRVERVESALREEREKTAALTARVAELEREGAEQYAEAVRINKMHDAATARAEAAERRVQELESVLTAAGVDADVKLHEDDEESAHRTDVVSRVRWLVEDRERVKQQRADLLAGDNSAVECDCRRPARYGTHPKAGCKACGGSGYLRHRVGHPQGPKPAPAGLLEAVEPVIKALEGYSIALAQEGGDSRAIPVWLSKAEARALLAAYDAATGGAR